jgi:hypothetical protein
MGKRRTSPTCQALRFWRPNPTRLGPRRIRPTPLRSRLFLKEMKSHFQTWALLQPKTWNKPTVSPALYSRLLRLDRRMQPWVTALLHCWSRLCPLLPRSSSNPENLIRGNTNHRRRLSSTPATIHNSCVSATLVLPCVIPDRGECFKIACFEMLSCISSTYVDVPLACLHFFATATIFPIHNQAPLIKIQTWGR